MQPRIGEAAYPLLGRTIASSTARAIPSRAWSARWIVAAAALPTTLATDNATAPPFTLARSVFSCRLDDAGTGIPPEDNQ